MNIIGILGTAVVASTLFVVLPGCDQQGPLEKAGEAMDDSVEDAGDSIEDAGDSIEDATDPQ